MAWTDARLLLALLRGQDPSLSLAARLDRFYRPQAALYDRFRERLLHGRAELLARLPLAQDSTLVELGAGTGRNLDFLGERLRRLKSVWAVDLCPALLERARLRCARWPNVRVVEADACSFAPPEPVDCVLFSYSLSMVPDWFRAVDNAHAVLKPGGLVAVADFYVSRGFPQPGRLRHGWLARHGWPAWFGHDGVHPNPDHLPYLEYRFRTLHLTEGSGAVPWLPGLRVPWYAFIGSKGAA